MLIELEGVSYDLINNIKNMWPKEYIQWLPIESTLQIICDSVEHEIDNDLYTIRIERDSRYYKFCFARSEAAYVRIAKIGGEI